MRGAEPFRNRSRGCLVGRALTEHAELVAAEPGHELALADDASSRRAATTVSSSLPSSWPSASLTSLNLSRSMKKTVSAFSSPTSASSASSSRWPNCVRLASPVRSSCNAWCAMVSSWRFIRRVTLRMIGKGRATAREARPRERRRP